MSTQGGLSVVKPSCPVCVVKVNTPPFMSIDL